MKSIKNVFITGGGGFLGAHVLKRLLPTCGVTLHIRHPTKAKNPWPRPGLRVISGEMGVQEMLMQLPSDIDAVIHLAGAVRGTSVESILDSNVVTTSNVLHMMEVKKIPTLVFMSTASVWSDSSGTRLTETTIPNPTTQYGYAKLAAERLIVNALRQGQISAAVILRCNNTYGPGCTQGAVANFRERLLHGLPIEIEGDGQQLREPLYVSDVIEVLVRALHVGPGMHLYGISGPQKMTVVEMASVLAIALGKTMQVDWKPENRERARHILVNTDKARRELGWVPAISYADGVLSVSEEVDLVQ